MAETKKVKHAGRFGSRYGKGIRDRLVGVEKRQRKFHDCSKCGRKKLKRISTGLFECKNCKTRTAGGAYVPTTMSGGIVAKMVKQKQFTPHLKELMETTEKSESPQPAETKKPEPAKSKERKPTKEKSAENETKKTALAEPKEKEPEKTEPKTEKKVTEAAKETEQIAKEQKPEEKIETKSKKEAEEK